MLSRNSVERTWANLEAGSSGNKAGTIRDYWGPGVNNLGGYGRWASAEFADVYEMQADFEAKVEEHLNNMIESVTKETEGVSA